MNNLQNKAASGDWAGKLLRSALLGGVSILAIGTFSAPGLAQSSPSQSNASSSSASAPEVEKVVVTGLRASLENSQQIKENANVFVDAITAQDIGALPDTNISDTIQRIPGVAINHFAGTTDPDHFSVEGSGVVIRGLSYVEGEFNGRDTFSVSDGRGLSFGDIPPELVGTVLVYKDQSADMVEGGISGTVDLHTRMPFDSDGRVISFNASETYGDMVKKAAPSGSVLLSDNWDTSIGKIGALIDVSHSQEWTRGDGSQIAAYGANTAINPGSTVYLPVGPDVRTDVYDYQKMGWDASAQWQSPDESALATFSFIRSQSDTSWEEHALQIQADVVNGGGSIPPPPGSAQLRPACTAAATCSPWGGTPAFTASQFNSQGLFTHGTITQFYNGWRSADSSVPQWGEQAEAQTRGVRQKLVTEDYSANLKWSPTDRLHIELDGHHVDSTSKELDVTVGLSTWVDGSIQNANTGKLPSLTFLPAMEIPSTTQAAADGYYSDPGNYFWREAMDHVEQSGGIEDAYRADVKYDLDDGWLRSAKFGARYSNQNQTVRYTAYNWGVVSEAWDGKAGPVWFGQPSAANAVDPSNGQSRIHPASDQLAPTSFLTTYTFPGFQRGQVPNPVHAEFYAANPALNYANTIQNAEATNRQWITSGGSAGWVPVAQRTGVIPGTSFLPAEINSNIETTWAAYGLVDFASASLFGTDITLDGNIGARFVDTRDEAGPGWIQFPASSGSSSYLNGASCTPAAGRPVYDVPAYCALTPAQQQDARTFANGATQAIGAAVHHHDIVLPSLNMKFGLTDDMLIRVGLSESISRPDLGLMRNSVVFSGTASPFAWNVYGGNPALKPVRGDNVDLSYEWYFAKTGSFTFAPFFKQLHGVVTNNFTNASYTNNGVTYNVVLQNEYNAPSGGKVQGFELAYQQFYSFLPSPLDGLGLSANFTYIDSSGVPQGNFSSANPNPIVVSGAGCTINGAPSPCTTVDVSKLPLQGLSRYNYNVTGMYEKGAFSARLAWNWRSYYLLTTRDVIYPFLPIVAEGSGTLDGSFFYSLNDNWKIGVQATNLLDGVTQTSQVLTNNLRAGRSWFLNDREFSFVVRANL